MLGRMVVLFLVFNGISIPSSIVAVSVYFPTSNARGFPFLHTLLMRWTNLEPILQSEVSQKEKYKYRILMHIYAIYKDGTDEFICRAAVEKQT